MRQPSALANRPLIRWFASAPPPRHRTVRGRSDRRSQTVLSLIGVLIVSCDFVHENWIFCDDIFLYDRLFLDLSGTDLTVIFRNEYVGFKVATGSV